MFKSLLVASAVLMILGSGLVSCSPDEGKTKVVDNFRANPPKILRAGGEAFTVTKENVGTLATLDIQDRFDLRESGGSRVLITATCMYDGKNLPLDTVFSGASPIPIYQIIFPSILSLDLKSAAVSCNVDLTVVNGQGSRHVFPFPSLRLTDTQQAPVKIVRDGKSVTSIELGEVEGITVRSESANTNVVAKLLCRDVSFPSIAFPGVLPLNLIDFESRNADPAIQKSLSESPHQTCRLLVKDDAETLEISSLFTIGFPLRPLKITVLPSPKRPDQVVGAGERFVINTIQVQNPEPVPRTLRIPNTRLNVTSYLFAIPPPGGLVSRWIKSTAPDHVQFEIFLNATNEPYRDVVIPASGAVNLNLVMTYFHLPSSCLAPLYAHTAQISEGVQLQTLSSQGQPEGTVTVDAFPEIWAYNRYGFNPQFQRTPETTPASCSWF